MSRRNIDRLYFPAEITKDIGLKVNQINFLKKKGCPFYGRKTTIRWVRDFIARQAGAVAPDAPLTSGHPQHSNACKSDGPSNSNG